MRALEASCREIPCYFAQNKMEEDKILCLVSLDMVTSDRRWLEALKPFGVPVGSHLSPSPLLYAPCTWLNTLQCEVSEFFKLLKFRFKLLFKVNFSFRYSSSLSFAKSYLYLNTFKKKNLILAFDFRNNDLYLQSFNHTLPAVQKQPQP